MRSKSVDVIPAKEVDLSILLDIFSSSRSSVGCYFEQALDIARFRTLIDGEEIHIAVLDGKIAGFASVWVADRFIHHLYV